MQNICLYSIRQKSKSLNFASYKIWKLTNTKLSIILQFVKYGIVFIGNLKYGNVYSATCKIRKCSNIMLFILSICKWGNLSSLWTSNIKISIFWRIQNLEICKYQGFYIVHQVKYKIDLYYEYEILQFRYFASSKFWKLPKLSIFCTFVKYGIVFIVNLKYANIGHNAKYGICHHYQRQISKFPFFE